MNSWMAPIAAAVIIVGAAIPMYQGATLSFLYVWLSLWLILYVIGFALIALEGIFFMVKPEIRHISQYIAALIATGVMAAIAAAFVSSNTFEFTLVDMVREFLEQRSALDGALRLLGVSGLYTLVYVAIGMATWPLVRSHYEDPNHGLALRAPGAPVIILLQMTRGLLTALALVPLVAAIPATDTTWWLKLSLLLATVMAIAPLLMATKWPARLRLTHAIEISVFAVVYSWIVWWLLS